MPRRARILTGFALALLSGAAVAWAVLGLSTMGPHVPVLRLPLFTVAAPLVGIAVFQLVYGVLTGMGRGWRLWAVALPLVYVVAGGGYAMALAGWVDLRLAALLVLAELAALGGLLVLISTGGRRAA